MFHVFVEPNELGCDIVRMGLPSRAAARSPKTLGYELDYIVSLSGFSYR